MWSIDGKPGRAESARGGLGDRKQIRITSTLYGTYLVFVQIVGQAADEDLVGRVGHHGADDAQDGSVDRDRIGHAGHRLIIVRTADLQTLPLEVDP